MDTDELSVLDSSRLPALLSLFSPDIPNRSVIRSVLGGSIPGTALADSSDSPSRCVVIADFFNWTFIGGKWDSGALNREIARLRRKRYLQIVDGDCVRTGLEGLDAVIPRCEFRHANGDRRTPEGWDVQKIDGALLERCAWKGFQALAYGSSEAFLEKGFGYVCLDGGSVCAEAYATFIADGECELGVITHEGYRRRGCAAAVASHLLRACSDRGLKPIWSCDQENIASVALADRLGFSVCRTYAFLYVSRMA